jgi:hypothetical protein
MKFTNYEHEEIYLVLTMISDNDNEIVFMYNVFCIHN